MATVSKWTPFGVALDLTATGSSVTRTSATQFTVSIKASWETYYEGAQTNYGMSATSGGVTKVISSFGTKRSSGSASFTGTYSISGNGAATKTITITFKNYEEDWEGNVTESASKSVSFNVSVPAWTSYTIKYNANGGSGAPGNQTKWKNQTLKLSSAKPTRTGYSFLGWSTSSTATSATYSVGGNYTANAAATLYAVWKANTYKVTFNANGGSGAPSAQTKTYGKTLTLSSTKPTRMNYTFKGWATSASATSAAYSAGGSYTANAAVTLYAVWELAYTKPRITNFSAIRVDAYDAIADDGTYARIVFDWTCDKNVSSVTVKWKLASSNTYENTRTIPVSGTTGREYELIDSLSTESSYDVQVTVTDSAGSSYVAGILPSMKFILDFLAGGNGMAAGKAAELSGVFDVGFQTRFFGGLLYPVLEPGTDLDTVRTPNTYVGENVSTNPYGNCPLTSGTFTLEVLTSGPNGQTIQRLTRCYKTSPTVYERIYYSNAWGEWYGAWIYPTLNSQFTMYGSDEGANKTKYRKDGRIVEVRGIVTPTSDIAGSTTIHEIFTLPSGYRPSSPIYAICQGTGNCTWLLRVDTNGEVGFSRYRNGDATAAAAAGTWLPFQVTFISDN